VDHDAAVAHEGAIADDSRDVLVDVAVRCVSNASIDNVELIDLRGGEGLVGGLTMLAGEVTDLAGSRESRVARRSLATDEGVDVGTSSSAVAVGGDRVVMDMVN
jgi:hypothetical protein